MRRPNAEAVFRLGLAVPILCAAVSLLVLGGWKVSSNQAQPGRRIDFRTFDKIPLKVREVRNLQKGEGWLRDLEIEVQNISDKPVYFISLIIEFPDIPAPPARPRADGSTPSRSTTGFRLSFGSGRLIDVMQLAAPDDPSLRPGETYVFRVPETRVRGWEHMKDVLGVPPWAANRVSANFEIISFGDATGFMAGQGRSYGKRARKRGAARAEPRGEPNAPPARRGVAVFQTVGWGGGDPALAKFLMAAAPRKPAAPKPARPQFGSCAGTGGCDQYYIENDSDSFCIDSQLPPNVCESPRARRRNGERCTKYMVINYTCGVGQPCDQDALDPAASQTCGESCDKDGDTYIDEACGGDDCNDNPSGGAAFHPQAGENCFDGVDNDCDDFSDCNDILCENEPECYCPGYQEEQGFWIAGGQADCSLCTDGVDNDCDGGYDWYSDSGCTSCSPSPVVIDVLGNGFRLTTRTGGVEFDIDGNGRKERIAWTAAGSDDAFLALDRNGNGSVNGGTELFGNFTAQPSSPTPNGFLALAEFDRPAAGGNGDGVIDRRDPVYASLRLWRDADHDGVSQAGELHALGALDVAAVRLDYKESKRTDELGNQFRYRAKVDDAKGAKAGRWAWDVFLTSTR